MNTARFIAQAIRFGASGVASVVVGYVTFLILFRTFGIHYLIAFGLCYCVGMAVGFLLNRRWTFRTASLFSSRELAKYLLVYFFTLVSSSVLLRVLVDTGGMRAEVANIFVFAYCALLNFLGLRWFVYQQGSRRPSSGHRDA